MITDAQEDAAVEVLAGLEGWDRSDIRAALEAAEKAAWQPIETAPEDRLIIVRSVWFKNSTREPLPAEYDIARRSSDDGCWYDTRGDCIDLGAATHWRHLDLPEAPE